MKSKAMFQVSMLVNSLTEVNLSILALTWEPVHNSVATLANKMGQSRSVFALSIILSRVTAVLLS